MEFFRIRIDQDFYVGFFLGVFFVLFVFRYNKLSRSDDACEHSLEIGYVSVNNLLPNQLYKQVIIPTELNRNMPVDRQVSRIPAILKNP